MFDTDLMTLLGLVGMMLLRLGVPFLVMGLLGAALKRIVPEESTGDVAGAYGRGQRLLVSEYDPQPV